MKIDFENQRLSRPIVPGNPPPPLDPALYSYYKLDFEPTYKISEKAIITKIILGSISVDSIARCDDPKKWHA